MTDDNFLDKAYDVSTAEETLALYKQWSKTYDEEVSRNGYASPMRTAQALLAVGAPTDAPLLDIGCGTGLSGLFLNQAGFKHIDGCDISAEMIEQAKAKGIYETLFLSDLNAPFSFVSRDYLTITAIGIFSPAHAGPETIATIFDLVPRSGFFAFSLNDHALEDPEYLANVTKLVNSKSSRIRWQDYGEHLPKIDLDSMIVVLEKL